MTTPTARAAAKANVLLAVDSLAAGNGGICRVARLMQRVLAERVAAGAVAADSLIFNDAQVPPDVLLPAATTRGSRLRFLLQTQLAAARHTHLAYDSLSMARANPRGALRRPSACYVHGIEVWEGCAPSRISAASRCDVLWSNSHYTRERAERVHPGRFARATVCWLATEQDDPAPPRPPTSGPPTVLVLGRLDKALYKGHTELIDCWPRVTSAVPDAQLLIVGGGPGHATIAARAAASPAAANIRVTGFVPEEQVADAWSAATVFAMPSRGEGFGLVYIEAMRMGIPVIASVHDAAQEVNVDGRTGYNVNLDRPDELSDRLIHLLRDPAAAAQLGRNGAARWQEHFCYAAFRRRFAPLLSEFLAMSR